MPLCPFISHLAVSLAVNTKLLLDTIILSLCSHDHVTSLYSTAWASYTFMKKSQPCFMLIEISTK